MAKRGLQLQTDIQTDEEFDLFLQSKGLLLVEVYSEWCGPCLGMVGTLRRVKMDVGDVLTIGTAKSDGISYLQRFYKRSEPIWLFITEGRAVNIIFGTDSPRLVNLIYEEIRLLGKFHSRDHYSITELLPEEIKRDRIKNEAEAARIRKETKERELKKIEFFTHITDTIRENLPDIGVTIFGPHINRDLFRKIIEAGANLGIQCKDRRNQPITKEQFDMINTDCKNRLPDEVIDAIDGKELFIGFWKIPDDKTKRTVPEVLQSFADEITKPHTFPPDEYRDTEEIQPPLVPTMKMKFEYELQDDEECPEIDPEPEIEQKNQPEIPQEDVEVAFSEYMSEMGSEEDEELPDEPHQQSVPDLDFVDNDMVSQIIEEEEPIDEGLKKNVCTKTITIPGIWIPKDQRTHAALIYVLFRQQTAAFLPPEPAPEPPHIIMAFNTYKQRDLIDFAERYKDDIPAYGFFTSDDADEAKFIANDKQSYAHQVHSASDKLVFKVNKRTSHTMLSLVSYGPTYVSFNSAIGQKEALKFFSEDYYNAEAAIPPEEQKPKVKTSKSSVKGQKDDSTYEKLQQEAKDEAAKDSALQPEAEQEDKTIPGKFNEGEYGESEIGEGELDEGEVFEGGNIGEGAEIEPPAEISPIGNVEQQGTEPVQSVVADQAISVEPMPPAEGQNISSNMESPP